MPALSCALYIEIEMTNRCYYKEEKSEGHRWGVKRTVERVRITLNPQMVDEITHVNNVETLNTIANHSFKIRLKHMKLL